MISERSAWGFGLATDHRRRCHPRHLVPRSPPWVSLLRMPPPRPSSRRWSARTRCAGSAASSSRSASTSTRRRPTPPTPTCGFTCSPTALVEPNTINLDGIFGALTNVVWTTQGPCAVDGFERDPCPDAGPRSRPGVRRRQVPADGRLRRACRSADRRRRPRAPGRAPRLGHDGDARGLRELQRRHPRHLDGRGPDQPGRRRGRRLRHRRRRLHHGHPLRRRH